MSEHGDEAAAVAALLDLAHGRPFTDGVPSSLRKFDDADLATGLWLQLAVLEAWSAEGKRLGGWKIGQTSRGGRDSFGVGVRPHGYVLSDRIYRSGQTVTAEILNRRLEPEIGLTLRKDLAGPDVTVEQARDAVGSVAPAFEINSVRAPKAASPAVRLGNSLNNWGIVLGESLPPDEVDLANLTVEIGNDHGILDSGASTPDVIDDPYLSLTRVCRSLALNGRGLHAGEHLITGSLTNPVPTSDARTFYAEFSSLGRVQISFARNDNHGGS